MQVQSKLNNMDYFLSNFKALDDSILISPAHWAALTTQSRASIYSAKQRKNLPQPVIEKNRFVRWTVGQYRDWANGLASESRKTEASGIKEKGGRPRAEIRAGI